MHRQTMFLFVFIGSTQCVCRYVHSKHQNDFMDKVEVMIALCQRTRAEVIRLYKMLKFLIDMDDKMNLNACLNKLFILV